MTAHGQTEFDRREGAHGANGWSTGGRFRTASEAPRHQPRRGKTAGAKRILAERRRMAWQRLGSGRTMVQIAVDQFAFLGGLPLPCFFCACGSAGFAFFACFARRRWRALVGSIGLPGE